MSNLSGRERELMDLAAKGLTDETIATHLGISVATVRGYWLRARTKLGGQGRAQLVGQWVQQNADRLGEDVAEASRQSDADNKAEFMRLLDSERAQMDEVFEKMSSRQRDDVKRIRQGVDDALDREEG